ncbi:MAG: PEP-CTERM sorting domain-containing protein [Verrucomicrobiota bacterium]
MSPFNKFFLPLMLVVVATTQTQAQTTLLAGWDFQTTANGGTAAAAAPGSPLTYSANVGAQAGTARIFLNGTNGSSTWTSLASNPQVTSFGGSNLNTSGTTLSTTTSGAASLAIANSSANGQAMTFVFSMTGFSNLSLSYATQRTSTGFTGNQWAYSVDGVNFTNFGTAIAPATSYSVISGASVSLAPADNALINNATTVTLRYTVTGASSAAGNNRLDNFQLNATAIPEPSTYAAIFGGVALIGGMIHRRRQRKTARAAGTA